MTLLAIAMTILFLVSSPGLPTFILFSVALLAVTFLLLAVFGPQAIMAIVIGTEIVMVAVWLLRRLGLVHSKRIGDSRTQ